MPTLKLGILAHIAMLALRSLRLGDAEFQASLGYIGSHCLTEKGKIPRLRIKWDKDSN